MDTLVRPDPPRPIYVHEPSPTIIREPEPIKGYESAQTSLAYGEEPKKTKTGYSKGLSISAEASGGAENLHAGVMLNTWAHGPMNFRVGVSGFTGDDQTNNSL